MTTPAPWFKQWELAVDSVSDLMILTDRERRVIRCNRAVERWGLATVVEVAGMDAHRLLHGECADPDCTLLALWSQMKDELGGERRVETEGPDAWLKHRVHVAIEPIARFRSGDAAARPFALITVRDITEVHRQKMLEERKTRFEALQVVVRSLAHEIGNPLAAIRNTTEVLIDNVHRFEPAKVDTYLGRLLEATERLQLIVDRSLRDQASLTLRRLPLAPLLERIHHLFADDMVVRRITFEVAFPETADALWVVGDLTAIEEALGHLLRNAMEATPEGGTIFLGHGNEAERISITIRDNGHGMDERQLGQVFQPFFTTKSSSMGIGLPYVHHLMTKMGGAIKIESHPGEGTEVTLRLVRWPVPVEVASLAADHRKKSGNSSTPGVTA